MPRVGSTIKVGLCAMDKKVDGKPMKELMMRLLNQGTPQKPKPQLEFVKFGDDLLLNTPVDQWPECNCLIAFYSEGFPLAKAMDYAAMYPYMYLLNDLDVQNHLFDRRWMYKTCADHGIPTPRHVFCNRGEDECGRLIEGMVAKPHCACGTCKPDCPFPPAWPSSTLEEHEDYIVVDGVKMEKPFVEKPASGEDHNVWIYYPRRCLSILYLCVQCVYAHVEKISMYWILYTRSLKQCVYMHECKCVCVRERLHACGYTCACVRARACARSRIHV